MARPYLILALILTFLSSTLQAELVPEKLSVAELPAKPGPHWVWVNDIAFLNMIDGRAYLVNADNGQVLGMLSTGGFHDALLMPSDYSEIYSTDTFYSRGTRGVRTDVMSIFDPRTLDAVGEVILPPKQLLSIPTLVHMGLTDDDRFLLSYNFTPAQTLTVVDTKARKLIGEIDTAGCAFVFPGSARNVHMICADGSLLTITLDDAGKAANKSRSKQLFDPGKDLINEDGVRIGSTWYFVSYDGDVYSFEGSTATPKPGKSWSLQSDDDRADNWVPGGYQLFAIHGGTNRMYVLMHQGGPGTHKNPGSEIWVYDLASKKRMQRIELEHHATSVNVSKDDNPLLYTVSLESPVLRVLDAKTGKHLRGVELSATTTPTVIQIP